MLVHKVGIQQEAELYSRVSELESSNSRLAKADNWEFTTVNDQLSGKRNDEVGLYRRTLNSLHKNLN